MRHKIAEARRSLKYDPSEPRDSDGRWTDGGGGGSEASGDARKGPKEQSTYGRTIRRAIDKLWDLAPTDTTGSFYDDLNRLESHLSGASSDKERTSIRRQMSALYADVRSHHDLEKTKD